MIEALEDVGDLMQLEMVTVMLVLRDAAELGESYGCSRLAGVLMDLLLNPVGVEEITLERRLGINSLDVKSSTKCLKEKHTVERMIRRRFLDWEKGLSSDLAHLALSASGDVRSGRWETNWL